MSLYLVRYLAMILAPSITSAARPLVTFNATQIIIAVLGKLGLAALPEITAWLVSVPALVIGAVLAVLEMVARHDPDLEAYLRDLQLDRLGSIIGALPSVLLLMSMGLPTDEATALLPHGGVMKDLFEATGQALTSNHPPGVRIAALGGALAINLGLVWLRAQIFEFLYGLALGGGLARLETGGILVLLVFLPILPLFSVSVMILMTAGLVVLGLAALLASRWSDQRGRVACSRCDYRLRAEASVCPSCGATRTPTVVLGQPRGLLSTRSQSAYTSQLGQSSG